MTPSLAQDKVKEADRNAPNPDVYIDGKKYDHDIIDLLDNSKIQSIDVFKGEQATVIYNAPNGVIVIKTKNTSEQMVTLDQAEIKVGDSKLPIGISYRDSIKDKIGKWLNSEIV